MAPERKKETGTRRLFLDPSGQRDLFEKSLEEELEAKANSPVECLGMTFENDKKRREYFLEKLRDKLKNPKFRKIEGFPIGSDDDILSLSDPPYYTACPNPFIADFIKHYGKPFDPDTDNYRREPFAADVSEGKNDPIYNAHSYHTKVPHKAIMRYILHYSEPGDLVFDGFAGTGMTGVAAQLCDNKTTVESLGYRVDHNGIICQQETRDNGKSFWKPFSKIGKRHAILNDLSPAATFIAHNYNTPIQLNSFEREGKRILKEVEEECAWMYETSHTDGQIKGRINYTVWSDVFICPECAGEIIYWEAAVDEASSEVYQKFSCSHCYVQVDKRSMDRAVVTKFDKATNQTTHQTKQVPVLISYSIGKKRFFKKPGLLDFELIVKIEESDIPYWYPSDLMMFKGEQWGDTWRRGVHTGMTHTHHFYTKRNLWVLAALFDLISSRRYPRRLKEFLTIWFTSSHTRLHRMNRYMAQHNRHVGPLSGTLYVSSTMAEICPFYFANLKINDHSKLFLPFGKTVTSTSSATHEIVDESKVDYIFTDPPFGGNLMYSELNFLWESWLKVFTNTTPEAIENSSQGKRLAEYQHLMVLCFQEYYRALKPGRWMTVVFHNSKNSVWNAIQEAIQRVGFVIADVRTLDKKKGTTKQLSYISGAVKQDLVISAYKPNGGFEERFQLVAGTEEGLWDFVRTHLRQLPVFVSKDGQAETIAERQNFLLFDRMVAFHVQRGVTVPLSAAEFYQGLAQRFPERDDMYFLPEQVAEYDKKRMTVKEVLQLELAPFDEHSAILWLRQLLKEKPQSFQQIHPQFLKSIAGWEKHEKPLELSELLEQNFLRYDGKGNVPSQIHSYLSTNFKELRNLTKHDPALRAKAKDRWYVPDPNKASDLEKLRERALLREFNEYLESKQKRLKVFRLEAVRAGFKKAWQERNYQIIINLARKIPEKVLQEDPKLLMWYDQAVTRTGATS